SLFSVLLRGCCGAPLPFAASDRLVTIQESDSRGAEVAVSNPDFIDLRGGNKSFSTVASYTVGPATVIGPAEPERLSVAYVSREFFSLFGGAMSLGRPFSIDDHRSTSKPVVIVNEHAWHRLFSDKILNNKSLAIDGRNYTVV